jgi:polyisoprenoid-binding protein YceI
MRLSTLATSLMLVLTAGVAHAEPRTFKIDPDHFSIGFLVEHAGYGKTLGMFREGQGSFVYDEAEQTLHSGQVTVQADSVFTNHDKRDGHLRSDDFLNADDYPEIRFKATDLTLNQDQEGTLTGELTLLGTTRTIELSVTINKTDRYPFGDNAYVLGASARGTIERSRFGMNYGVDGDLVGDEVELILEFEAVRQPRD